MTSEQCIEEHVGVYRIISDCVVQYSRLTGNCIVLPILTRQQDGELENYACITPPCMYVDVTITFNETGLKVYQPLHSATASLFCKLLLAHAGHTAKLRTDSISSLNVLSTAGIDWISL